MKKITAKQQNYYMLCSMRKTKTIKDFLILSLLNSKFNIFLIEKRSSSKKRG